MGPHQSPYDDQDAEVNLPSPSSNDDLDRFKRFRSHRLRPITSTPDTRADPGSPLLSYRNAREMLISRAGSRYASSSASPRAQETLEEEDDRDLTLPPVLYDEDEVDDRKDLATSLGYLDLTDSRTPSPIPKTEPGEIDLTRLSTPTGSPPVSESNTTSHTPHEDPSPPRAHLCVEHLPSTYDSDDLLNHFSSLPGVEDASVQKSPTLGTWGIVAFRSLMAAQHAHAKMNCTVPPGGTKAMELKIYSADGRPIDSLNAVGPVNVNVNKGAGQDNPRVPPMLSAAELQRRIYIGNLPFGVGTPEVARIFWDRAGVKVRVLSIKHAWDGSHSFAFVQNDAALHASEAIKRIHGTRYDGPHLLRLEPVNEFFHDWKFSLRLEGLPGNWGYRHISDFLITTIHSFAGLRVHGHRGVRVEFRYETELRWAAGVLEGREVLGGRVGVWIEQDGVRKKMEEERRDRREIERVRAGWERLQQGGRDRRYGPTHDHAYALSSALTSTRARGCDDYEEPPTYSSSAWYGATASRRNERSMSPRRRGPTVGGGGEGGGMGVEAYNPLSPKLRLV
ncbi:hypothetical protein JCM1840_003092 [Sporobolomyces johnsonii]